MEWLTSLDSELRIGERLHHTCVARLEISPRGSGN
jgi:hypothetical protein